MAELRDERAVSLRSRGRVHSLCQLLLNRNHMSTNDGDWEFNFRSELPLSSPFPERSDPQSLRPDSSQSELNSLPKMVISSQPEPNFIAIQIIRMTSSLLPLQSPLLPHHIPIPLSSELAALPPSQPRPLTLANTHQSTGCTTPNHPSNELANKTHSPPPLSSGSHPAC